MIRLGVRAGMLGALGAIVISLFTLIPLAGNCLYWLFNILLWITIAALVARGGAALPKESHVAVAGAVAGFIAATIGGLVGILLAPVGLILLGGTEDALRLIPPELLQIYQELDILPTVLFSPVGVLLTASFFCGFQVLLAPGITALASVFFYRWWGYEEEDMWEEHQGPFMLDW